MIISYVGEQSYVFTVQAYALLCHIYLHITSIFCIELLQKVLSGLCNVSFSENERQLGIGFLSHELI